MRTETEVRNRLEAIIMDERLKQAPASVQINAPLALIQISLESIVSTLKWVLNDEQARGSDEEKSKRHRS